MASDIDICNLALGHLGDTANVSSIDPPEGSAQAEHCARFYPIARDALLEVHTWGFATRRISLALLTSGWPEWNYAYAQPADALNILEVMPPDATDDYSQPLDQGVFPTSSVAGKYVPQPFSCETDSLGRQVIYTDQVNAVLRYTSNDVDPAKFSPTFTMALSYQLASMLAGPIIKGDAGAAAAKDCLQKAQLWLSKATASDANQRKINPVQNVPWVSGR